VKLLDYFLDFLMFVVPILELADLMAFIPPEYLPYYMITTVVLRRLLRLLEDKLRGPTKTSLD
jgi:hypothetical protein